MHGLESGDKYVPQKYKVASKSVRLAVLAGLMDTDGSLSLSGFDFVSKSPRLADDVVFLSRSVGLAAYVTPCMKGCQTGAVGRYYRVSISGHTDMIPTKLPRKKAAARRQKKDVLRTGFSIRPLGIEPFFGFTLTGDGRYVMGDFTVTHNSGKTTMAAEMIHRSVAKGGRVLVLAHRKELIDQLSARIDTFGIDHGVVMAGHPRALPWLPVQVASVQTLIGRESLALPDFTLIVIDEAHRAKAKTYTDLLARWPKAFTIGLSATPWRGDGKGLGDLFDGSVIAAKPRELIESGRLVPYVGFSSPVNLSGVAVKDGDYDATALASRVGTTQINGQIVERWLESANGLRTVVFACTLDHSRAIVAQFVAAGVAAEHLDGTTGKTEREAILARIRSGATKVVSNVGVLTEGWDLPDLGCVILARPTKSLSLYMQSTGRVLRTAKGKSVARIHDHAGVIIQHGLPDADHDYSLTSTAKKQPVAALRHCKECFAVWDPPGNVCPQCGAVIAGGAAERAGPQDVDVPVIQIGELQTAAARAVAHLASLRASVTTQQKASEFKRLTRYADEKGYKKGWAAWKYKEQLGVWPRFQSGVLESAVEATQALIPYGVLKAAGLATPSASSLPSTGNTTERNPRAPQPAGGVGEQQRFL